MIRIQRLPSSWLARTTSVISQTILCKRQVKRFLLSSYQAIITAMAALRDPTARTSWRNIRKFLLGLLDANDNTLNPYSDSQYLATLVAAIGNVYSAMSISDEVDKEDMNRAVDVISRTMTMDRLVPSYQNVVTQAGMKVGTVHGTDGVELTPVSFEAHRGRQN